MSHSVQVNSSAYRFDRYISKARWASFWHQLDEVIGLAPSEVLEVGAGSNVLSMLARRFGVNLKTVDIDPELRPDYVASILDLPFGDGQFDVSVAFQTLEHLPIEDALRGFSELLRVTRRCVVISLPDVREVWAYCLRLPKVGYVRFSIPRPRFRAPPAVKVGNHYWEVGRAGYSVSDVIKMLESCGARCQRTYRVFENPYHRFFVLTPGVTPSA